PKARAENDADGCDGTDGRHGDGCGAETSELSGGPRLGHGNKVTELLEDLMEQFRSDRHRERQNDDAPVRRRQPQHDGRSDRQAPREQMDEEDTVRPKSSSDAALRLDEPLPPGSPFSAAAPSRF